MPVGFGSLVVVVVVAALAPIVVALMPGRLRLPQVVLLRAGILVGPSVAGWAEPDPVSLFSSVGLGFLFLLAGYELDPKLLQERAGMLAARSWLVTVVAAAALLGRLYAAGWVDSPAVVAIALTTTALGTLLPILRDNDMLGGRFGRYVSAAGAVGELGPIVAMALFLGTRGSLVEAIALIVFVVIAYGIAVLPGHLQATRIGPIILRGEHSTSQTTLRLSIALLFVLLLAATDLGFDNVLGAFVAGMVLRRRSPGHVDLLEAKLDAVGYGFFIPIFFVYSGMTLDVEAIIANPAPLLVFFAVMFVVRGLPALFWYRRELPRIERVQLVFITATALPLLVALSAVGVADGTMTTAAQAAVIGAGVLSVLVFRLVAVGLQQRKSATTPRSDPAHRTGRPNPRRMDSRPGCGLRDLAMATRRGTGPWFSALAPGIGSTSSKSSGAEGIRTPDLLIANDPKPGFVTSCPGEMYPVQRWQRRRVHGRGTPGARPTVEPSVANNEFSRPPVGGARQCSLMPW